MLSFDSNTGNWLGDWIAFFLVASLSLHLLIPDKRLKLYHSVLDAGRKSLREVESISSFKQIRLQVGTVSATLWAITIFSMVIWAA